MTSDSNYFRQLNEDGSGSLPVIFEVVPPHKDHANPYRSGRTYGRFIGKDSGIAAIWISEVIDESIRHGSPRSSTEKVGAAEYASIISNGHDDVDTVVSIAVPYIEGDFEEWARRLYDNGQGVKNLVLVGPRTSREDYPGPGVREAAERITELNQMGETDIYLGGIWIHFRDSEHERMLAKTRSGIKYFLGQIGFEADSVISVIRDYGTSCEEAGVKPSRVYPSFSPVTSKQTASAVEYFRESSIPDEFRDYIDPSRWEGMANRSLRGIEGMFTRIRDFHKSSGSNVPLGVTSEHLTQTNFQAALELLDSLPRIWRGEDMTSEYPHESI